MCDKLVFDLAQEIEGSPQVFVRKDWLNILDNQNQNYNNNQSVIDTSQLSNSNKWMNYREAYFSIPFLITLGQTTAPTASGAGGAGATVPLFNAVVAGAGSVGVDYAFGLKNWFGQIIHSFTLDYNGTTVIQQTPYVSMWNSFKLMTSLSYGDLLTQGDVIGFYPDDATSWEWNYSPALAGAGFCNGTGVCNNSTAFALGPSSSVLQIGEPMNFDTGGGNIGHVRRLQNINFDVDGIPSTYGFTYASGGATVTVNGGTYGSLISGVPSNVAAINPVSSGVMNNIWKSYIQYKSATMIQTAVVATVYLKHVHSFFNMVPLLKGVFMKMTMNLNNTSVVFTMASQNQTAGVAPASVPVSMSVSSVQIATGGVCPLMISAPAFTSVVQATGLEFVGKGGSYNLLPTAGTVGVGIYAQVGYTLNLSVGATCLNQSLAPTAQAGNLSKSVYLYIPAYTFNPPFESSYLSSPVKVIKYTDIYQYQVLNVAANQQFNNLLTNGIANVKSVLILPFYSSGGTTSTALGAGWGGTLINSNTGFTQGVPVFQSPFDPAGTGPTSPLCFLSNFNIQVSGQNAIYNIQRYSFEQFNNQLAGQNAVNGGLTDGLTSGLVGRTEFDMEYCYYYVNVERMLPVEETVPKSIQILGTNQSSRALDLYCFVEYGCEIKIDAMTGARV
jgi:hypothetical protein